MSSVTGELRNFTGTDAALGGLAPDGHLTRSGPGPFAKPAVGRPGWNDLDAPEDKACIRIR
jgi:hypothetical protein